MHIETQQQLSYDEYFGKVDEMANELRRQWQDEQRVKALKLAIQLAKLLADSRQTKLYARKYKLIIKLLDEFGHLVYLRIHSLISAQDEQENELAADICRNWFLKVASIRELIPRFYIELALLKTSDIFTTAHAAQLYLPALRRLTRAAWGLADPVVALHARAYLCHTASRLLTTSTTTTTTTIHANAELFELMTANLTHCVTQLIHHLHRHEGGDYSIHSFELIAQPLQSILNLLTPSGDFELSRAGSSSSSSELTNDATHVKLEHLLIEQLQRLDGNHKSPSSNSFNATLFKYNVIIYSISKALPCDIVASSCVTNLLLAKLEQAFDLWLGQVVRVNDSDEEEQDDYCVTTYLTLTSLLVALDGSERFEVRDPEFKLRLLQASERIVHELLRHQQRCRRRSTRPTLPPAYLRTMKALLAYTSHHFACDQIDWLLTQFVIRLQRGRQYVGHHASLLEIIKILFTTSAETKVEDFKRVFNLRSFNKLMFEFLPKQEHKLDAARWLLETMRANLKLNCSGGGPTKVSISDRQLINFLLKLFATINDSLSPLMSGDDLHHLAELIIYFLELISLDDPLERLEFCSRARNSVSNLTHTLEYLINLVLEQLPVDFRRHEKRRNARQNFLNGCLAYSFATIPAIPNQSTQLDLYLTGARLALINMSLSLAEYFMRQVMLIASDLSATVAAGAADHSSQPSTAYTLVTSKNTSSTTTTTSKRQVKLDKLIELVVEFEDRIDLKHKLALANLIKQNGDLIGAGSAKAASGSLLKKLKHLNCSPDELQVQVQV